MTPPDLRAPRRPRGVDQLCLTEKPRTALSSRRLRPDSVFDMEPSLFCHGATVVFGEALQVDITHRWTGFGSEPRRRSLMDAGTLPSRYELPSNTCQEALAPNRGANRAVQYPDWVWDRTITGSDRVQVQSLDPSRLVHCGGKEPVGKAERLTSDYAAQ
ncbi:hypothetical protein F2P81_022764 [Scophthalmus maximus]|uniref:Uncharacterized protein n=1 Tax=Scophthalmus maximus TaxID=52904 RepID=A0A6A4RV36_SCOMX|nr:hypothetical protein F2P81_022764 [Scophthalmus maximus]